MLLTAADESSGQQLSHNKHRLFDKVVTLETDTLWTRNQAVLKKFAVISSHLNQDRMQMCFQLIHSRKSFLQGV